MGQVNRFPEKILWRALATGLGLGYLPIAPGTFGSLLALPAWYFGGGTGAAHYAILAIVLALSVPAARAEMEATGRKDPPSVVVDEVAGMLAAASGIPWGWKPALTVFLLFRFFDIVKFGPAAWLDGKNGAVYVVADDLAAGVYANLAYRALAWLTA